MLFESVVEIKNEKSSSLYRYICDDDRIYSWTQCTSVIDLIILQETTEFAEKSPSLNKIESSPPSNMFSLGKDFQKTAEPKMNEIQHLKIIPHQKEIGKPSKDTLVKPEIIGTNLNEDFETQLGPAEYHNNETIPRLPPSTRFPTFFSAAHKYSNRKVKSEPKKEIKGEKIGLFDLKGL